jgi:hypothetical protein
MDRISKVPREAEGSDDRCYAYHGKDRGDTLNDCQGVLLFKREPHVEVATLVEETYNLGTAVKRRLDLQHYTI